MKGNSHLPTYPTNSAKILPTSYGSKSHFKAEVQRYKLDQVSYYTRTRRQMFREGVVLGRVYFNGGCLEYV